ncbi:MAG TPA: hypothetical protein VH642_06980, partial [Streptosporangiaceae bacterium]
MSTAPAEVRRGRTGLGRPSGHDDPGAGRLRNRARPAGTGGVAGEPRPARGRGQTAPGQPRAAAQPAAAEPSAAEPAAAQPVGGRPAAGPGPVVAITGAAHGLGHALAGALAVSARVGRVVA